MPKRKRYLSKSTSTPVEANSLGLNENVSHGQPHSEPLSQIGLSSHHVGQTDPYPQPTAHANRHTHIIGQTNTSTHQTEDLPSIKPEAPSSTELEAPPSTEPETQNAPLNGYGKKSSKYWIVELEGI